MAALCLLAFFAPGLCGVQAQVVTTRTDTVGKLLNEWFAAGTAAGLKAFTYENRDNQHSLLSPALYPQLQMRINASDTGAAMQIRDVPTIGNCSMASGATQVGCLPRLYMMDPNGSRFLARQYLSNNLFIYPEHQDYDIGANGVGGYGDLLPLNTPALLISQGSSYTDQPFVQALFATVAAFPPATQKILLEKRLLMPTLQSIFRRSNRMVQKPEDYFAGKAHPPVFDGAQIDEERMVRLAHEMTPDKLPPVVVMEIVEETKMEAGKDYFEMPGAYPWQLADSPFSIGRVFRGNDDAHGMLISLEKTLNPVKSPLQMRAVLLQGDPRFVRIEAGRDKAAMRLRVRWAPPTFAATGIRSHRIDIGIFADNGISPSAPAIISFYMLPNEMHFYDEKGRVSEIHYQTHNPDFGLPPADTDPRWLKVLLAFSLKDTHLRSRLVEQVLSPAERDGMQKTYLALKKKADALAAADGNDNRKEEAGQLRQELGQAVSAALKAPVAGKAEMTTRGAVEKVLNVIANLHTFYVGAQRELDALAVSAGKPTAVADIRAEIHRLSMQGVLLEQASGQIGTLTPLDQLSLGERHMLRGLNLTLLSQVLFPEALERSTAPAYVSPRLTTPKQWRDVYRYDPDTGKLQGWLRYSQGRIANFDADGRLLPDGPRGKAVPVRYLMGDNGTLVWDAQPGPGAGSKTTKGK